MATSTNPKIEPKQIAIAKALNIPVSTKHCIEICDTLRFRDVSYAKQFLEEVVGLKRPVSFKKFVMNTGHKKGMSTGRYPTKAASEILKLLKAAEANAQFKGLNTTTLKISKLVANRASIPFGGGRHRVGTKRSHVEIEVKERGVAGKKPSEKETAAPNQKKKESVQAEAKQEHIHTAAHPHADHDHAHVHEHGHEHSHQEKNHEHVATPAPAKPAVKAKVAEEVSSAELLRRAQEKAAQMKVKEKERKDTQQVENLYEELQKKGSLRSTGGKK